MKRMLLAGAMILGAMALGASPASAKELRVDDDHAQCPNAQFTSIQAAVAAADQNDTVKVCPGTYTEQVRIETHAKDGLKLVSLVPQKAIIQAPPTIPFPKAIVLIEDANRVEISFFTIRGPYVEPGCGIPIPNTPDPANPIIDVHKGVYVKNGFSERIERNHILDIRNANPALFGCQDGIAVQVGRAGEDATGSARVTDNLIAGYQKGGVVVDNAGSYGHVDHNVIRAATEVQPNIAPNGVQVSRGAGADVDHNRVSRNKFLGNRDNGSGSGILLYLPGAGKVEVDHNDSFDNDDGLPLLDAHRERIEHNYSHDNVFFDGLFADQDSTHNWFVGNVALRNAEHDCHDDSHGDGTAGTANFWKDDVGVTQTPTGICRPSKGKHRRRGHDKGEHETSAADDPSSEGGNLPELPDAPNLPQLP